MHGQQNIKKSLLKVCSSVEHLIYYPTSRMFHQHLTQEQFVNIFRQNSWLTNKLNNIPLYKSLVDKIITDKNPEDINYTKPTTDGTNLTAQNITQMKYIQQV